MSADIDCEDDCCTYPRLNLSISHRHRDTLLLRDSAYTNDLGQIYRISSVSMLVSDFYVTLRDDTLRPREQVTIGSRSERRVTNDHFQISTSEFSYLAGRIAGEGDLSSLRFTIGSDHIPLDTTLADDDYRLRSGLPNLAIDGSAYASVNIVLDSLDTDTLASWLIGGLYPINLDLQGDILVAGDNLTTIIEVDYARWLDDVDLLSDSVAVVEAISRNIDRGITIRR